jgi:hypothetical protein
MKIKTDEFDFTSIDFITYHKIDEGLESKDQIEVNDKKIIDGFLKTLSKSRKYSGKFFPCFKIDLLKNGTVLYEIYVNENYLNINGMVLKSSKNIGKIIKRHFHKYNQPSNPSN